MLKKTLLIVMALGFTIALTACGNNNNNAAGNTNNGAASNGSASNGTAAEGPAQSITVKAKNFEFDQKEIRVKQGTKVTLTLENTDGAHGLAIPEYGVDIKGGESAEFVADKKGEFPFQCSLFCGTGHGEMTGKLIVE